jgi:hypothetical protein
MHSKLACYSPEESDLRERTEEDQQDVPYVPIPQRFHHTKFGLANDNYTRKYNEEGNRRWILGTPEDYPLPIFRAEYQRFDA